MRRLWTGLVGSLALLAFLAPPAAAEFSLKELSVGFQLQDGSPATKAGSHPYAMTTRLFANTKIVPKAVEDPVTHKLVDGELPDGEPKDLTIAQMAGLVGSQTAVKPCSRADFATREESYPECPDASAVGYAAVKAEFGAILPEQDVFWHVPLYSLEPSPGAAATFGFIPGNVPVTFDVMLSPSPPYNLVARLRNIPQALLFFGSEVQLWGVPADPAHDSLRGKCVGEPATASEDPISKGTCPFNGDEVPLLTLPRSCRGPLQTLFDSTSWQGEFSQGTATTAAMGECEALPFAAQSSTQPTTTSALSPSGLDFGLETEDEGLTDPKKGAQADVSAVRVTLPEGMSANPAAAEGQGTCSQAAYEAATLSAPGCPPDSKLGSLQVSSPLLEEPLGGSIYLAEPRQNPFGTLLAAYLTIRHPRFGVFLKQAGAMRPDPATGQLTATFEGLPELPFSDLAVHFREGPRAPLITPSRCGAHTTEVALTPSSGNPPLTLSSSFQLDSGPGGSPCPDPDTFAPRFLAGSLSNQAGAYSPFYMRFSRSDADGEITGLTAALPPGLIGKLAGVGRCSEEQIAAARTHGGKAELAQPSCPSSSRIGRLLASGGVGQTLAQVSGSLYLAGPYKGAPLSAVSVIPALAGPFDLGTVVVRSALRVDPRSAQVSIDAAASDPIPRILEGIPVRLRDLEVYADRPQFTLNPTSCDPEQATATLFAGSLAADLTQRFQAQGCDRLPFKPRLALKLKGATERGGHPALTGTYAPKAANANLAGLTVRLPRSAFLDQAHIRTICTRIQFSQDACPKGAIYGQAEVKTPLLDDPLKGPVYLRSSDNKLPDMVLDLHGLVDFEAIARIDSQKGGIRATFQGLPDAPLAKATVQMQGARKGLIVNSTGLCKGAHRASVSLTAHNGKRANARPVVGVGCGKGSAGRKREHRGK